VRNTLLRLVKVPFVPRSYLRKSEVYRAGDTIELDHALTCDVRSLGAKFTCKRRVHQRDPLSVTFGLVSWNWPTAVVALDHLAPPFSSLASSAGLSLLRQILSATVNPLVRRLNVVMSSRRVLERLVGFSEVCYLRRSVCTIYAA